MVPQSTVLALDVFTDRVGCLLPSHLVQVGSTLLLLSTLYFFLNLKRLGRGLGTGWVLRREKGGWSPSVLFQGCKRSGTRSSLEGWNPEYLVAERVLKHLCSLSEIWRSSGICSMVS